MQPWTKRVGAVAIGRNEGERLRRCLESLQRETDRVVYVDSGSDDGSPEMARARGVEVVDLDMSIPFTASRARNTGFERLRLRWPEVEFVQFVDGDMEVLPGWLQVAVETLDSQPEVVAVIGWRRERHPERSVYNRVCDVEWRMGGVGETENFGGDVMFRAEALAEVGGYDTQVIAAEDDELGVRLRERGGVLLRLDHDSTLHDADMHRFRQWWTRAKRCGHAYAQVSAMHGGGRHRKFVRELRRAWLMGAVVPGTAAALTLPTLGLSWLGLGIYPLNAVRIARDTHRRGFDWPDAVVWGVSCALSPIPQAFGAAKFLLDRVRDKRPEIIEWKGTAKRRR
ncbi:MAG: glycosyltransferase family 2 protein [Nannocystaceae bacterium]|nr:glycosyltransferase family 2 protein [Nannocystaceae bacterium]